MDGSHVFTKPRYMVKRFWTHCAFVLLTVVMLLHHVVFQRVQPSEFMRTERTDAALVGVYPTNMVAQITCCCKCFRTELACRLAS